MRCTLVKASAATPHSEILAWHFSCCFVVSTGDNWNGIMKDTLRDCAQDTGTCYNTVVSPIYFVSFVLTAQFVLVNGGHCCPHETLRGKQQRGERGGGYGGRAGAGGSRWRWGRRTTGGHISPLAAGDMGGSGGSPWVSRASQDRGYPTDGYSTDSPPANIRRDSAAHIKADPPQSLEPPLERRPMFDSVSLVIQGSLEGELSLMDNLSGSICHYYALPPLPSKHSTEKKGLISSCLDPPSGDGGLCLWHPEKSWSLALTDDSVPDDFNPPLLTSLECNTADPSEPVESVQPHEPLEEHLLCVKKTSVGRTHSLPNDSYMYLPLQPTDTSTTLTTSAQQAQSGSSSSVQSHAEEPSQHLTVPTELFRPISPHSLSDSESIPRIPPPRRHTLSRTLRRQVAVSADSQEALSTEGVESEGSAELSAPPRTCPVPLRKQQQQQQHRPLLFLVPATPGASPKAARSSVHTQHNPHDQYSVSSRCPRSPPPPPLPKGAMPSAKQQEEEDSVDQEVSHIIRAGFTGGSDKDLVGVLGEGFGGRLGGGLGLGLGGLPAEARGPCLRQLKKYHSADAQAHRLPLLPRPSSWLDDPRRHSIEVCSSVESSPQRSSTSSGFVSRDDSLQTSQPSPHTRKKKMSPPCISVDPPEGLEAPGCFRSVLGMVAPPPLPSRDTCLRRRAPSSDSKDSFDLGGGGGGGDGLPQEGVPNPKLLTLPNFSFEKSSSEH
ncbi:hypothetical protein SRHO_G00158920 [Serrasalmus rhombeus]